MRLLSRLLIILAICLVAVTLPASPAQAQGADILLSPDDGFPGEEIPSTAIISRPRSGLIFITIRTAPGHG